MSKSFEFFFDYISPFSYIGFYEAERVARRTGAEMHIHPMFLGGVMKETGNRPPGLVPAKGKYMADDLARVSAHHGLTMTMNPHFPMMNTRPLLCATIALASDTNLQRQFIDAAFNAVWNDPAGIDVGDWEQLGPALSNAGLDPTEIQTAASLESAKQTLRSNTESAIARGAFGAPSIFVGDDLYFGHDRLDYVERALGD